MKFRLIDLLQCPCGQNSLVVKDAVTKRSVFSDRLSEVKCKKNCAFKQCPADSGQVTPADCNECYSHEINEGTITCQCGMAWPIVGGIPRLLPASLAGELKKTQETFSYEWKMFRFGERNWGQDINLKSPFPGCHGCCT